MDNNQIAVGINYHQWRTTGHGDQSIYYLTYKHGFCRFWSHDNSRRTRSGYFK